MSVTLRMIGLVLIAATAAPVSSAWSQAYQEVVTDVWVHDVPGPPQGDFWDPVTLNLLSSLSHPEGIYPDVVVCARPVAGRTRTCTQPVCWNLQGDAKMGGQGRSKECQRALRITLPPNDPRIQVEVLEMDDMAGRQRVQAVIGQMDVPDPAGCPHAHPCEKKIPKGTLALSFSTMKPYGPSPPAASASPGPSQAPARCTPSPYVADRLRGPYASIEEVMRRDDAGPLALLLTRGGLAEYGFVILRDRRQQNGGYYATSPIRSSENTTWRQRAMISIDDYASSRDRTIMSSCANKRDFVLAATVHTHPDPTWDTSSVWLAIATFTYSISNNFTASDFTQAVQLKTLPAAELETSPIAPVQFEKIVMINANDHEVRVFEPRVGDATFSQFGIWVVDVRSLPRLSLLWGQYADRVQVIATYP